MRSIELIALLLLGCAYTIDVPQRILENLEDATVSPTDAVRTLHGKFLHITDFHPDPFYKTHTSTEEGIACHRHDGSAGIYGAETTDCDSPFSLVNATFTWIAENIRDDIDFVIWTGDSARHDSDEEIPRSAQQVLTLNNYVVSKFMETFADNRGNVMVPIIPTWGNNDMLPHNILQQGPNKWTRSYTSIWRSFIPEEQRHGFERGGWFYVEVIPNKLAVFSLNTMYFFDKNAAVDGCSDRSEPGFQQMEWLRIQLGFMRRRGIKVILMGHVPPARTKSKQLWDESCWQRYTLWSRQYRDIIVGSFFGHMNIDHFLLQDSNDIDLIGIKDSHQDNDVRDFLGDELTTMGAADYLEELRVAWETLPDLDVLDPSDNSDHTNSRITTKQRRKKKSKKEKAIEKLGGPWAERYQLTSISPSVVPNFFPTLRIVEYNLTDLDVHETWSFHRAMQFKDSQHEDRLSPAQNEVDRLPQILVAHEGSLETTDSQEEINIARKKKKRPKPKDPNLIVPDPPSSTSRPGPAYSPQTLSLLGYTQYFANLTRINNDFSHDEVLPEAIEAEAFNASSFEELTAERWNRGRHGDKRPHHPIPQPQKFEYEVEYSTFNDSGGNGLEDMTVKSYLKLAARIALYDGKSESYSTQRETSEKGGKNRKHKKKKKDKKRKKEKNNEAWYTFVARAFVGILSEDEIRDLDCVTSAASPD